MGNIPLLTITYTSEPAHYHTINNIDCDLLESHEIVNNNANVSIGYNADSINSGPYEKWIVIDDINYKYKVYGGKFISRKLCTCRIGADHTTNVYVDRTDLKKRAKIENDKWRGLIGAGFIIAGIGYIAHAIYSHKPTK